MTGDAATSGRVPPPPVGEASHGIVETARRLFGASTAVLYRVEAGSSELSVVAAVDDRGRVEGPWPPLPLEDDRLTHRAVQSREIAWRSCADGDGYAAGVRPAGVAPARMPGRGMLAAPLLARDRVVGLLVLHGDAPGLFGDGHVEPARAFADHAVSSLETARLGEEHARLADALARSEARYRAIVDTQTELICRTLLDGTLTFVNEAYARYFDVTPTAAVGQSCYAHVAEQDVAAMRRHRGALTPDQPPGTLVSRARTRAADVRWVQWTSQAVFDRAGRATEIQAVGRDVTAQTQLEERLLESQKMDAVGELAAGIAHDFNNLLTIVMGGSHLLLSDLSPDNPHHPHAQAIARAADEAADLVRQLLAFGRRQPLLSRPLRLDGILEDLGAVLRGVVREDIELVVLSGAGAARVQGDAGQLEQVILNLVLNACEAMPRGGRLEIATRLTGAAGQLVALSVRDTGVGMSAEVQGRAFDPFFTTKERSSGRGRGLGLSVVYGVVKQSGGDVIIESTPDRGTRVTIELPRLDDEGRP